MIKPSRLFGAKKEGLKLPLPGVKRGEKAPPSARVLEYVLRSCLSTSRSFPIVSKRGVAPPRST